MVNKSMDMTECIIKLDEMNVKLSFLAGIANTCGAAFEDEKSISILDNKSIQGAFYSINRQTEVITEELEAVIRELMETNKIVMKELMNRSGCEDHCDK